MPSNWLAEVPLGHVRASLAVCLGVLTHLARPVLYANAELMVGTELESLARPGHDRGVGRGVLPAEQEHRLVVGNDRLDPVLLLAGEGQHQLAGGLALRRVRALDRPGLNRVVVASKVSHSLAPSVIAQAILILRRTDRRASFRTLIAGRRRA